MCSSPRSCRCCSGAACSAPPTRRNAALAFRPGAAGGATFRLVLEARSAPCVRRSIGQDFSAADAFGRDRMRWVNRFLMSVVAIAAVLPSRRKPRGFAAGFPDRPIELDRSAGTWAAVPTNCEARQQAHGADAGAGHPCRRMSLAPPARPAWRSFFPRRPTVIRWPSISPTRHALLAGNRMPRWKMSDIVPVAVLVQAAFIPLRGAGQPASRPGPISRRRPGPIRAS